MAQDSLSFKREFRGVWVATVVNIDWPSKPGLTSDQQKIELVKLLDAHKKQGINAIMLQIRPTADAFYAKSEEPWSMYLTGKQGMPPYPFYDPLEFAIDACHQRGIELHAWFNPYRATFDGIEAKINANHISKIKPEWFFSYDGKKLFNPGLPEVRQYITRVILNVVDNYDIDGVHFDDYFYPYTVKGKTINDAETFILYNNGIDNINDWRRNNINQLIETLNDSIHAHKKYMKFGVSPFGIWKNRAQDAEGSETSGGDSYYEIFADSRKWVQNGWVDYINPQIYWSFSTRAAPYANLVDWWAKQTNGRQLYIGLGAYRVNATKDLSWRNPAQLGNQISYARKIPTVNGSVFFSSKSLTNNPLGISDSLKTKYFKFPALPPSMPWLDSVAPKQPKLLVAHVTPNGETQLNWAIPDTATDNEDVYGFVVYRFDENEKINLNKASNIKAIFYSKTLQWIDPDKPEQKKYKYVITALDRLKNESLPSNEIKI